ncbi:hypothetical protein BP5796_11182 [Coleophoma crateriformis]|uniref:Altered inheritance of mitochondria protein 11 n=1 Tax=Coleophoma crateriformis TaxID=565419 RepID=A0A3D8QI01_9HELO|nr:hypothetical protein BP5796_11182 [Coleophoma crateriformis]
MADSLPSPTSMAPANTKPDYFSRRSRRQLSLFAAGVGFFGLTSIITRRALVRRYKATIPKFFQPNNRPSMEFDGALEAFEALSIATINVASVGMIAAGGLLWAFDISSIEDMRKKVRTNMGTEGLRNDQDAEEEIEEWMAGILGRKDETLKQRARAREARNQKKEEMDGKS